MKKFFSSTILILSLFVFSLPCNANNFLQQHYETTKMSEMAQEQSLYNVTKERLLENDYQGYLNGGRSLYGYLLAAKKEAQKKNSTDLKYIKLMLNQYNMRIKTTNPNLFKLQKITVDDQDYIKLTELTKLCLYFHNFMAY